MCCMGETSNNSGREVASLLPFSILRYLGRAVGRHEAERVRVAAGEPRTMAQLVERGSWSSLESTKKIALEAARLTGDAHIGRRGGEELFRFSDEVGFADAYRAAGSIEAGLEATIVGSSKASTGRLTSVVDRTATSVLAEGHYSRGTRPDSLFCDYAMGYWSGVPTLFGATAYAVELECEARGDDRCLIQISWVEQRAAATDAAAAGARMNATFLRYEQLERTASDLLQAEDATVALDLVVARASSAVLAPRFLLAVELPDDAGLRVHHLGFQDDASARRAAQAVLDGRQSSSTAVADVATRRHHYGVIAALYPKGTQGTDNDVRLLSSYATHAAAALEAIVTFEDAQRDRDTANALLDLSRRLADVTTVSDVARRLAEAIPAIAGGGRGSIYLWNAESGCLEFETADAATDLTRLPMEIPVGAMEGAAELLAALEPVFLDVEVLDGDLKELMVSTGAVHNASIPIVARGDLLGLVSATFERRLTAGEQQVLIQRLSALADQAATAFDNARLLEHTRHQATHDGLTGLPNRPMLEDRVDQLLKGTRDTQPRVGLLFVDIDRFKLVNDTFGHHAGDDLIRQVAGRLRGVIRDSDTLARLGGDEFVVLLPEVDDDQAALVAERLVAAMASPFSIAGQDVFVSCSIGVAVSPCAGTDYGTLLQHADAAMYEAKAAGRNAYAVHVNPTGRFDRRRVELESALHNALDNRELGVVYQPQVELHTGRIVGAEALVRWHHPVFGAVGPDVFIPIAEDSGLILEIDRWVRLTALAQVRAWQDAGLPPLRISCNLSTRELRNPSLPAELAADLADAGVDPALVELEITERVVMADSENLVGILQSLRAVGVRLAIDDFGTGSAVLGRLQHHPVDTLKIDRSFINELTTESSAAVVSALVEMGGKLGIEVLAEGVETEAQRAALLAIGCPLAQGYLFSRPVAADALAEQLAAMLTTVG